MKISETTTIGFASAGHTLCHLLTLLFPTVLLALEVELELSFKELATLAVPAAFLFGAGALPAGLLGDRWSKTTLLEIFFLRHRSYVNSNRICQNTFDACRGSGRNRNICINLSSCRYVLAGFQNIQNRNCSGI